MIERLRRILEGIGYELGGLELLDVLWLARAIGGGADRNADAVPGTAEAEREEPAGPVELLPSRGGRARPGPRPGGAPATHARPAAPDPAVPAEDTARQHQLFTAHHADPGTETGAPARAIHAPGPRALPGAHGLARALRPLRGHRDHRHRTVADIEATVRVTAESGVLDVIDRPKQELRHTAVLLVDESASMRVWQPLVREVRRLLERGGVFRSVRVHRFDLREDHRPGTAPRTDSPVVFVLTDGVDEAWRGPAARRFLGAWERSGPLIVVPPLPRRLWRGTAFDARPRLLVAESQCATNRELDVIDPLGGGPVEGLGDRLPVPVVPLTPATLHTWARLLTRPRVPQLVDTVLVAPDAGGGTGGDPLPPTPEKRLERFRASFSPEAYRLAVRLSTIRPLSMPVIQLMRIATMPDSTSAVVSEVLLGDVLQPLGDRQTSAGRLPAAMTGGVGEVLYDFQPGVRDLLASGLDTEQSLEVIEAVGRALEPHLGRMPDFAALLADPGGSARLSPGTAAFAVLVSPVLDRLYGGPRAIEGEAVEPTGHGRATSLQFTAFGPEPAWWGDEPVSMGTAEEQAVLAVLLLRERPFVTPVDLVYTTADSDRRHPADAIELDAMRDRVARLREILAPMGVVIDSEADGFLLRSDSGDTVAPWDLSEAERLHTEAKAAYASDDSGTARRLLGEAVRGLVGTPLDGVPGLHAETQRTRLTEWRLMLVESRIHLDLELGEHEGVIPELEELIAAYPLREHLRAQLMVALYCSGRQNESLAVYADTRRLLAHELGVDPGPELRELQDRMRRGEPPERMRALRYAPLTAPTTSTDPTWPPAEGLSFGLLGPVRAWRDADPVATGSPQQRALLACLLLRGGRTATAAELIDAIWGAEPPSQALAAVRTYASRLRKLLGPETLLSKNGGYALRLSPGMLDLHAARDLVSESEQAQDRGDLRRARELLTQSLVLWAGEALTGLPGPYAETERVQLEEWRLQLLERRLDMDLQEGAHAEVVPELTTHTAAHPLRERLRELLMLALYRSGRQAEALAVYADTRRVLADELGIDPSPALQQLQERILTAEDSLLAVPSSRPEPPPATPVRPSQLPATVPDFTGRAALVRELGHTLTHADDPAVAVAALAGIGGVGKTTLAVHVAHEVRPHFPDGQLYVDLQGAGPGPTDPPAVLGAFLRALGTPDSAIASDVAERAAQFRAALDGRRILVLLDNARDAAQVRPLLPGTPGCAALVTSRGRMADLPGTHLVDLDAMSPEEALLLFTRIAGKERISTERAAALEVVAACGFLPLAIRIAASRLAAHRTWTVTTLAAKLADEHRRLDELQAGDLAVKAAFELGYGQLEADQARAFRLLSLADGPDISLTAAAAVLDLAPHRTDDLLEALVDTSLLESASPGRYRYHNLVRLFARACVERDERPSATGEMALSRLLDFYLSTAALAYSTERPGDRLVDHLEATAYRGLTFADSGAAQNWLYTEADCLLACVRQSAEASRLSRAVDLLWVAQDLSESGTHSGPYASAAEALRTAAATAGDLRTMARTALIQAEAEMPLGRFAMARDGAEQALRWASRDTPVECRAASLLGVIALYQSRYDDADRHLTDALHAFRSASDRPGEASALGNLSRVRAAQGDSAGAITLAQEAMDIYDSLGLSLRGANARYALGLALTQAGRHEEANAALYEARNVFRTSHQPLWEGMALFRSAEADLAAGHPRHAAAHAEESLERIGESGGQWRRGNILVVLGRALHAMEQTARARTCWEEALSIFEELGSNEAEQVRDLLGDTVTSSHNGSD